MLLTLTVMGVLSLLASTFLPALMFKNAKNRVRSSRDQPNDPSQSSTLDKYGGPFVIRLAFAETIAVYGFVMSFLSGEFNYFLFASAPAALIILRSYPTKSFFLREFLASKPEKTW